jgi:hypothetical protein
VSASSGWKSEEYSYYVVTSVRSTVCVITLGDLGNCAVDQIFHICSSDISHMCSLCACDENPDGTGLLGLGIPSAQSQMGYPASEDTLKIQFVFSNSIKLKRHRQKPLLLSFFSPTEDALGCGGLVVSVYNFCLGQCLQLVSWKMKGLTC